MANRPTEPVLSQGFQLDIGHDVAAELRSDDATLDMWDCMSLVRSELSRLGEPEPTDYEIIGMILFYANMHIPEGSTP